MAERPNAKLLKSFGMQVPVGSNPTPSARDERWSHLYPYLAEALVRYQLSEPRSTLSSSSRLNYLNVLFQTDVLTTSS
jgi:hypothetical protein